MDGTDEASSTSLMMRTYSTPAKNKALTFARRELFRMNVGLHVFHTIFSFSLLIAVVILFKDPNKPTNGPLESSREVGARDMPTGGQPRLQPKDLGKFQKDFHLAHLFNDYIV